MMAAVFNRRLNWMKDIVGADDKFSSKKHFFLMFYGAVI